MTELRIAIASLSVAFFACSVLAADEAPPQERVTLMGMLSEWMYPGSEFHGAESGDAGVSDISAIKSKAILTTTDPVEEVMKFYRKKLNVDGEGRNLDEKEGERVTTGRSVLIQDVSGEQPSSLYVVAINSPKSSTTLVVSRPNGANVTRIAWSNYRQLQP